MTIRNVAKGVLARLRTLTTGVRRRVWGSEAPVRSRSKPQRVFLAAEFADAPIASFYASASAATVVDVPLHRCRGLWFAAFPCVVGSDHPFIRTMLAVESGAVSAYAGSPLEAYYERWRPSSAAESLGLHEVAGPLGQAPAHGAVAPWWPVDDLAAFASDLAAHFTAENSAKGSPLGADSGFLLHGPVAREKGELEFARCVEIYQSIRTSGYHRSSDTPDGDVRGQVLVREGGDYAVLVMNGQHRVAAAVAAGMPSVPIRFQDGSASGSRVAHRADVEQWPAVRRGWLTVREALHVFDRIFDGRPPWTPEPSVLDPGPMASGPIPGTPDRTR